MKFERFVEIFDDDESDEYLKFERIENKRHSRPDIHAFLLLDELQPNPGWDIVSAAEHDVFFLDIDAEKLALIITEKQVIELLRCGVHWSEYDCLAMFA